MINSKHRKLLLNKSEQDETREICLRLLSRREHSRWELRNKLGAKGFTDEAIMLTIANLAREGLQSDQRFKHSFVRQRIDKGYGPLRIIDGLRQCGIIIDDLDAIAQESISDWMEVIERVYNKKYPPDNVMTAKEWAKRLRFLQQRGYTFEIIDKLYKRLNIEINNS